jgi:hypothetical protein
VLLLTNFEIKNGYSGSEHAVSTVEDLLHHACALKGIELVLAKNPILKNARQPRHKPRHEQSKGRSAYYGRPYFFLFTGAGFMEKM